MIFQSIHRFFNYFFCLFSNRTRLQFEMFHANLTDIDGLFAKFQRILEKAIDEKYVTIKTELIVSFNLVLFIGGGAARA